MKLKKQPSYSETKFELTYEPWKKVSYEPLLILNKNSIYQRFSINLGGNNQIKPEEIIKMLENILLMPNLLQFDFILGYCNYINGDVLKSLANSIRYSQALKSLNISFDVETINTAKMTQADFQELENSYSQFPLLEQVKISLNRNQIENLSFISSLLSYQNNLKNLKLEILNVDIQSSDIESICNCISKMHSLIELSITIKKSQKPVNFIAKLFSAIQNLKDLHTLNFELDDCNLADSKLIIDQQTNLKVLKMNFTNLKNISADFYEQLRYLNCMPYLEQLDITFGKNNKIGSLGVHVLKETFLVLKNIRNFSLKIDSNNEIESESISQMIISLDVFLDLLNVHASYQTEFNSVRGITQNGSKFFMEIVKDVYSDIEVTRGFQKAIKYIKNLKQMKIEVMQSIRQMAYDLVNNNNIEEIEIKLLARDENLKCVSSLMKNTDYFNMKNLSIQILHSGEQPSQNAAFEFENSLQQFVSLKQLKYNFCKGFKLNGSLIIQQLIQNLYHNNFVADIEFTPSHESNQRDDLSSLLFKLIQSSKDSKQMKLTIDDSKKYIRVVVNNFRIKINYTEFNPNSIIEHICYGLLSLDDPAISFNFIFKSEAISLKANNSIISLKPCEVFGLQKTLENVLSAKNELQNTQQSFFNKRIDYALLFDLPFQQLSSSEYNRHFILPCEKVRIFLNSNTVKELQLFCSTTAENNLECYNSLFSLRELKKLTLRVYRTYDQVKLQNDESLIYQEKSKILSIKILSSIRRKWRHDIYKCFPRLCVLTTK